MLGTAIEASSLILKSILLKKISLKSVISVDASLASLALKGMGLLRKQKRKYALDDKLIKRIQFKT